MFVFQNSLFAVRLGEELWRRMSKGEELRGEGMIGNKKLTYLMAESFCDELLVTGDWLRILDFEFWMLDCGRAAVASCE